MSKVSKKNRSRRLRYFVSITAMMQGVYAFDAHLIASIILLVGGFLLLPIITDKITDTFSWVYPESIVMLSNILVVGGLINLVIVLKSTH